MNSLPVWALPEVEGDLRIAIEHYSSWRSDGADHVLQKYNETTSWIGWNPEAFPQKHGPISHAILKQSYYIVYFVVDVDRIVVLAVLDGRRNPREIRAILKKRKVGSGGKGG